MVDIARYVMQRIRNPRFLSRMAFNDVASNVCQALVVGSPLPVLTLVKPRGGGSGGGGGVGGGGGKDDAPDVERKLAAGLISCHGDGGGGVSFGSPMGVEAPVALGGGGGVAVVGTAHGRITRVSCTGTSVHYEQTFRERVARPGRRVRPWQPCKP